MAGPASLAPMMRSGAAVGETPDVGRRTLGDLFGARPNEASNNYLVLRLIAASLVIIGHAPSIAAPDPMYMDLVTRYLGYEYSGSVGLYIFFVISGFLVTASYQRRGSLIAFAKARALRIYPGLIVCTLISALILGPCFSSAQVVDYFESSYTWSYLGNVGSLYGYAPTLPSVVFNDRKWGIVVNGSLWSIFVEARLYVVVALFGVFGLLDRRARANIAIAVLFLVNLLVPNALPFFETTRDTAMVSAFFALGVLAYLNRIDVPLKGAALALLALSCLLSRANDPAYQVFAGATLVYAVFFIAYLPKIRLPHFVQDYSYGIYLYGWPVKQVLAHFLPCLGPVGMMALALPISWCLGALSWFLVEKRALQWKEAGSPREPMLDSSLSTPSSLYRD
jgi:peptidoglycan/LPS O-acetylase OafA/YrhL